MCPVDRHQAAAAAEAADTHPAVACLVAVAQVPAIHANNHHHPHSSVTSSMGPSSEYLIDDSEAPVPKHTVDGDLLPPQLLLQASREFHRDTLAVRHASGMCP